MRVAQLKLNEKKLFLSIFCSRGKQAFSGQSQQVYEAEKNVSAMGARQIGNTEEILN